MDYSWYIGAYIPAVEKRLAVPVERVSFHETDREGYITMVCDLGGGERTIHEVEAGSLRRLQFHELPGFFGAGGSGDST